MFFPQERDLWATLQEHDSSIYTENGFEMLVDVDGSMFNYKQVNFWLLCYVLLKQMWSPIQLKIISDHAYIIL